MNELKEKINNMTEEDYAEMLAMLVSHDCMGAAAIVQSLRETKQ